MLTKLQAYLNRLAEKWVSITVLVGCVLITGVLVFAAVKADALGNQLGGDAEFTYSI